MSFGNDAMKQRKRGIFIRLLRQFRRDKRGLSAIEFAFIFPVMATLYLTGTALTQGIVIKRKVTLTTRTIGDLISQDTQVTDAERDAVFTAGTAVMQPYPTALPLTMTITSLNVDENGVARVEWSDKYVAGQSVPGRPVDNQPIALPDGINEPNTHVIWAEGSYAYTPPVGAAYFSSIALKEQFYLRPRRVAMIKRCATGKCP